jgi:hypothetical protein
MTETRETNNGLTVTAPTTVKVAFWLFIAIAAISLVSTIISEFAVDWGGFLSTATAPRARGGQVSQSGAVALLVTVQIAGYIGIAITVLLAFLLRQGYGVARVLVTIQAVFGIIGLGVDHSVINILALVVRLVAVVLVWLPASSEYFAAARARRERERLGIPAD